MTNASPENDGWHGKLARVAIFACAFIATTYAFASGIAAAILISQAIRPPYAFDALLIASLLLIFLANAAVFFAIGLRRRGGRWWDAGGALATLGFFGLGWTILISLPSQRTWALLAVIYAAYVIGVWLPFRSDSATARAARGFDVQ